MRSTLIALAGSIVLVASAMMISPVEAEAKGKWPKVWTGTDKNWTSKPFKIRNRPGTDLQYNYIVFTAKKKPGTNKCIAKFGLRDKGVLKLSQEITTTSRRPKVVTGAWVFEPPDWVTQLKGRVGVKTNGKCVWSLALLGPRKGQPPEA